MGGVTHIDAEHVGAGLEQVCRSSPAVEEAGAERRDDLGPAQTFSSLQTFVRPSLGAWGAVEVAVSSPARSGVPGGDGGQPGD